MVGDRVLVDLGDRSLLAPDHGGEVAEVVGGKRNVRRERLPHGLAVLPALRDGEHLEVLLDRVRHLVQDTRALRRRRLAPRVLRRVRRVERELDVLRGGARNLGERLARGGRQVVRVLALHRRNPVAADEVLVARLQLDGTVDLPGAGKVATFSMVAMTLLPSALPAVVFGCFSTIAALAIRGIRHRADAPAESPHSAPEHRSRVCAHVRARKGRPRTRSTWGWVPGLACAHACAREKVVGVPRRPAPATRPHGDDEDCGGGLGVVNSALPSPDPAPSGATGEQRGGGTAGCAHPRPRVITLAQARIACARDSCPSVRVLSRSVSLWRSAASAAAAGARLAAARRSLIPAEVTHDPSVRRPCFGLCL